VAARAYNSPGVVVVESPNPTLAPLLASPSIIAVVGSASGLQSITERLVIDALNAQTLGHTGVHTNSVIVKSTSTGETLNAGNYTVTQTNDPDSTVTGDEVYAFNAKAQPGATIGVVAGTGTLTGTYQYAATFVNSGGETGIGDSTSNTVVLSGQGSNLSTIPVGPSGTTGRNIYRKKTAGSGADNVWHLVASISDNSTTVLTGETTSDGTAANGAQPPTGISDGDTIAVSYTYTDALYYEPTVFDDLDDVYDKYGPAFDSNGNINSKLSFAARLAFLNGASELICTASATGAAADIEDALERVEDDDSVRIVLVADGSSQVNDAAASHVDKMNALGRWRIAVIGRDGSTTAIDAATLRAAASGFNDEAVQLVSPASFKMQNPVSGRDMNVGGQWMAAAVAGMWAARDVQIPLTRKSVGGFSGIADKRTESDKAIDSSNGLLVVEDKGGTLRVRHSVTTAIGAISTREGSVVRAKYEMAHRLREVLDAGVVGIVLPQDRVPLVVQGAVASVLEQLVFEQAISSYQDIKARVLSGDPTTVEVKFGYVPAYPINNVQVVFTVNTVSGDVTGITT